MERYYKVLPDTVLHRDYMRYLENGRVVNEVVKQFMQAHGIETKEYCASGTRLYIAATDGDRQKFATQLMKAETGNGLVAFKKTTSIGKEWAKIADGVKPQHKPFVPFYFRNVCGKMRSRLFNIGDDVYCSLEANMDFETPEFFCEMKASEFFKVIEDHE